MMEIQPEDCIEDSEAAFRRCRKWFKTELGLFITAVGRRDCVYTTYLLSLMELYSLIQMVEE